jgi:NADPH:quinone reductase-like Zn-dependent oxidoreductase
VLVNGAASGVSRLAVQLAKWQGAYVIAVASGGHEALLRELGTDEFIDYTKTPAEDVVQDVDLVLDTLSGPTTDRFLRTLRQGGALFPVFLGFTDTAAAAQQNITVSMAQVRSDGAQLTELGHLLAARGRHGACRHRQHVSAGRDTPSARTRCSRTHSG